MADEQRHLEQQQREDESAALGSAPDQIDSGRAGPDLHQPPHAENPFTQQPVDPRPNSAISDLVETANAADAQPGIAEETADHTPSTRSEASRRLAVGDHFAGFRLLGILGEGGFGTVFRAEDQRLGRKVALKVLHARALRRAHAKDNFLKEARAMAAIQHDHVAPIYQVGEEEGQLFIAMPLLGGETLASRLEREGALADEEISRIGRQIACGLAAIHAKGLIHRDLKPGNIWLESGVGRVKVLDLGLAHDSLSSNEGIAGTPQYMSPEQAEGKDLDARSDLFSLGAVLYECATGRMAFKGPSISNILLAVREREPASAAKINPALSRELIELIGQLLQKNPARRPGSALQIVERMASGADGNSASRAGEWIRWIGSASWECSRPRSSSSSVRAGRPTTAP